MAHKKAGGTAKNLTDVNPHYLGVKLYGGEKANIGSVIVRQRGTKFVKGKNVLMGKDHTIYSIKEGTVSFNVSDFLIVGTPFSILAIAELVVPKSMP